MTNIHDLTNLLRDVRSEYQTAWQKAEEERKQELATLQRDYVRNTPTYAAKEKEIQLNYEVSIVAAREKAAKKTAEEIEELKAWEQARIGRIDETALSKNLKSMRFGESLSQRRNCKKCLQKTAGVTTGYKKRLAHWQRKTESRLQSYHLTPR